MKILLKIAGFGGGAPLSVLQYVRILKNHDLLVAVHGSKNKGSIAQKYTDCGIPVNYSSDLGKLFAKHKFIKLIKSTLEIYDDVILEKIDTIISVSNINIYLCSYICKCLEIDHLIIIAGGDMANNLDAVKYWSSKKAICFSQENKDAILSGGYPEDKIKVISNRISCEEDSDWKTHYSEMRKADPVVLLMTSRLDPGKTKSVIATMELTKWLSSNNQNVVLRIAGGGNQFDEINALAQKVNQEVNKELINMLGHVDDMKEEFQRAHFVFGKGRSVLEPIMMNRIGFVVGEDGNFSLCNENSVDNLYHYNFAGRNISCCTSKEEILGLINKVQDKTIDVEAFYKTFENVRDKYHINYLEDNFYPMFEKEYVKDGNKKKVSKGKYIHKIILFYAVFNYFRLSSVRKIKRSLMKKGKI